MAVNYVNLPGLEANENRPGLMKNIYIAPVRDFATLAVPAPTGNMDGSSVVIAADHTFNVGRGWVRMYSTLESAQLIAETIGERDGRGHRSELTAFRPGVSAANIEFANKALYDEFIILVETLEGEFLQMGSERMGVECTGAALDTGTVGGGRKGYTFTFDTFGSIYVYNGAITELP
jgi:hypothetical protein